MVKKVNKKRVILGSVILCVMIAAGTVLGRWIQDNGKDEKNTYIALKYLEIGDYDMGTAYLNKVDSKTAKKIDFARSAAEVVVQSLIGNNTLLNIKLDILAADFSMDKERMLIVEELQAMDGKSEAYADLISGIVASMDISDRKIEKYQMQFDIETQAMNSGYMDESLSQEYADMCGEDEQADMMLTVALSNGDYYSAVERAAGRVAEKPSSRNRLLLADVLARAAYAGYSIDEAMFYRIMGENYDAEVASKKNQKMQEEMENVGSRIQEVQNQINTETDGSKVTELDETLRDLYEQQDELLKKNNNQMIYRAMNSISGIFTAEAKIVMAKLYYALDKEEEAIEVLTTASDSVAVKLSNNDAAKQGLALVEGLNSKTVDASVTRKMEASQMIECMFNSTIDIPVRSSGNYYTASLAEALTNAVLAKYKYQNNEVYISSVDDSNFPEITCMITARDEILQDIEKKNNCVIKDTHYEVEYTTEREENVLASIGFVVDISGSMAGAPIENARKALISFADTLDDGTEVALVSFDDAGYIVTPVTTNLAEFSAASNGLTDGGGTNITAGIRSGIEAMQDASGAKNMILMTDGQSDIDYSVADDAAALGITIFTVGFGDVNQDILKEIAERTGGTFTLATDSGDLENVYESIGTLIGSRVKVTYTVTENPEEVPRYVFVQCDNYNTARRYEYRAEGGEEKKTFADGFYITSALEYDLSQMEWYINESGKVQAQLGMSDTSQVESLEVNGQKIIPKQDDYGDYIEFEMDAFTEEGLYDITVNFSDTSTYTAENAIVVYNSERENSVFYYNQIRIGSVMFETDRVIIMPDGKAVMVRVSVKENNADGGESTLAAYTQNLLVIENFTYSDQAVENGYEFYWDLGDSAQFRLDGVMCLNGNDAQSTDGSSAVSAVGKLKGIIDSQQCTIIRE